MIDVTCVDASEGLYAVFMDEEGISELVDAFVWTADVVAHVTPLPSTLNHLSIELEQAQEWRETRLDEMARVRYTCDHAVLASTRCSECK